MKNKNNFIPTAKQLAERSRLLVSLSLCLATPFSALVAANAVEHASSIEKVWQDGRKQIKGVVTDENGDPLPGINVYVKGTTIGVRTDLDGSYVLNVPSNAKILVFSCIGIKTEEIQIGKRSEISVVMKEDINQLGDVVVTGIFTRSKETYTGAVTSVTQEQLQNYRGQNLIQTLKNIDASLNIPVNNLAGSDPNHIPTMNIRGASTLPTDIRRVATESSVNNPVVMLDGFEVPFSRLMDMNDSEIESINILKDASATAIYGSRGANGVIVIVTKKPAPGRLKVQGTARINLEFPDLSSYHMLNAREKLELEKIVGVYKSSKDMDQQSLYDGYYNERLKAVLEGTDTDWLSKPLRNGIGQGYNLRLEGGSDEFRWSMDGNYNLVNGVMKGSKRQTISNSLTLIYTVKNFRFQNYSYITNTSSEESKYGGFSTFVSMQPYNAPYDKDGKLVRYFPTTLHSSSSVVTNPLYEGTLNNKDTSNSFTFTNNFSVDWTILPELILRGQLSISKGYNRTDVFLSAESGAFTGTNYRSVAGMRKKGTYDNTRRENYSFDANFTLNYNKILAEKHMVYVGLNYMVRDAYADIMGVKAEGFSNENLRHISNATQWSSSDYYKKPTGGESTSRQVGFAANLNYTYDNRYYVDGSYRLDGSSEFGADKRFAPFWSVGLGWNMHNEKFLRSNFLNTLRLRFSVGETGTMNFSTASVITTYAYNSSRQYLNWNTASLMGWGNPSLTWQKTREYNVGTEFAFFQNLINGRFDVYKKTTTNLLSKMELPNAMGFTSYDSNVGSIENTGFELSLNGYILRNYARDYRWSVGVQLVYDKNKIGKLSEALKEQNRLLQNSSRDVSNLLYEGYPVNSIWAVRSLGIDPSYGNEVLIDNHGNVTSVMRAEEKVFLGSGDPLYRGIANSQFYWKGFYVNMSFTYRWGGLEMNQTLHDRVEVSVSRIMSSNVDERVLKARWMKPGDLVEFRNFDASASSGVSSRFVQKDRTLELSSLNVGYRFESEAFRKRTKLNYLNFSINMSNVAYWSTIKQERGTSYPFARNVIGTVTIAY